MKIKSIISFIGIIIGSLIIVSCEKEKTHFYNMNPWITYGHVTDIEGNVYNTIPIGSQTWMVSNLKALKFRDGTSIPVIVDATSWSSKQTPACCWQNNDLIRKVTYGVLYNWHAVNTGKLCPAGWHVPSDAEWTSLTDFLGGEGVAGGKLKESGFRHWISPNTGATNETAFWAYPGGDRSDNAGASFEKLLEAGCWWTTEFNEDQASSRIMYYNSSSIQKLFYSKRCGLSVRCVQDY
jgi:uncharacterized protein (TIGR02145 family)